MSKTTKTALEMFHAKVTANTKYLQQQVADFIETASQSRQIIEAGTEDYLNTGVAYSSREFKRAYAIVDSRPSATKEYFQALAKEHDRPLLYADDVDYQYGHNKYRTIPAIQLQIPGNPKLKPLMVPLSLVAVTGSLTEHPVTTAHSDRIWRFNFQDNDAGRSVFNDFRRSCHENKVWRIILRLNNLPAR